MNPPDWPFPTLHAFYWISDPPPAPAGVKVFPGLQGALWIKEEHLARFQIHADGFITGETPEAEFELGPFRRFAQNRFLWHSKKQILVSLRHEGEEMRAKLYWKNKHGTVDEEWIVTETPPRLGFSMPELERPKTLSEWALLGGALASIALMFALHWQGMAWITGALPLLACLFFLRRSRSQKEPS